MRLRAFLLKIRIPSDRKGEEEKKGEEKEKGGGSEEEGRSQSKCPQSTVRQRGMGTAISEASKGNWDKTSRLRPSRLEQSLSLGR